MASIYSTTKRKYIQAIIFGQWFQIYYSIIQDYIDES